MANLRFQILCRNCYLLDGFYNVEIENNSDFVQIGNNLELHFIQKEFIFNQYLENYVTLEGAEKDYIDENLNGETINSIRCRECNSKNLVLKDFEINFEKIYDPENLINQSFKRKKPFFVFYINKKNNEIIPEFYPNLYVNQKFIKKVDYLMNNHLNTYKSETFNQKSNGIFYICFSFLQSEVECESIKTYGITREEIKNCFDSWVDECL
ncbi:MAG: hypothetical protein V9E90_02320 [Saprospiraceae bacterium]